MAKDETFKLRLEEAERLQLDALAAMRGVSAAQMIRELIREAASVQSKYRVSAWDGMVSTCLFWVGKDRDVAVAKAEELAKTHEGGKWTIFRVYEGDDDEPFKVVPVARGKTAAARVKSRTDALVKHDEDPRARKR